MAPTRARATAPQAGCASVPAKLERVDCTALTRFSEASAAATSP
jgi:hypothetical protein